jgi:hypothetical protein
MLKTFVNFQKTDGKGQVTNTAEIEAWNLKDVTYRNYIFATLTKPMKESLYSCDTAADMWTRLNNQYQLRAANNLHLLWQSFYDFSHLSGDDMTTHLQKLSSIADKLRELGQPNQNGNLSFIPSEADGLVVKPYVNPEKWEIYNGSSSLNEVVNKQRIFFHETSGLSELSLRQCCAVESAARHNPDRNIQLFLGSSDNCGDGINRSFHKIFSSQFSSWLKVLSRYTNLSVVYLNEDYYFSRTPFQDWDSKGEWRKSLFKMGHLSDFIQILTLYKGSGMYMDLDIMTLKTFHGIMFNNYLVYENAKMDTIGKYNALRTWAPNKNRTHSITF